MRAPSAWNFFGFSRNSLISCSSSTASSTPATSLKPIFGESGAIRLARDFPNDITFEPPPWTWFIRKIQNTNRRTNGTSEVRIDHHGDEPTPFESKFTFCFVSSVWICACDWSPA
jgi:hypothetical protein